MHYPKRSNHIKKKRSSHKSETYDSDSSLTGSVDDIMVPETDHQDLQAD